MIRNLIVAALAVGLAIGGCGRAPFINKQDSKVSSKKFGTPASADATVEMLECSNNPGPQITLSGALSFGGLGLKLIFRNNAKGTHERTEDGVVTTTLISLDEALVIPKQPVLGGVGGNPRIYLQLVSDDGVPLTSEAYLGRCVQGLTKAVSFDYLIPTSWDLFSATTLECNNNPGPYISLDGVAGLSGVNAVLIFRNNEKGTHETTRSVPVSVSVPLDVTFPKQPVLGGVGGNPRIYLQFVDGSGNDLSSEYYLGRCVQLSK